MLSTDQRPGVAMSALQRIIELIREGHYAPSDRLPSERTLAEQLKVSRTSVRDAIRRLETMGMVESRAGLGTFVKEPTSGVLQAALASHIFPDQQKLEKLFEVREIIEIEAAARAAEHATDAQIETIGRLAKAVERSIAEYDGVGRAVNDVEFHRQIVIATGNDILVDLVGNISGLLHEMRAAALKIPEGASEVVKGHQAIVAAIAAHDSQAAREAMRNHLTNVRIRARQYFASLADSDEQGVVSRTADSSSS
jgi:GntR family transcriptional repressor for pyruvate dehydrogenase complex